MINENLWGILILAAQNKQTLTEEQLRQLMANNFVPLSDELRKIEDFCHTNQLPPLELIVQPNTSFPPDPVWNHDWSEQEVPDSREYDYSPGWYGSARERMLKGREIAEDAASSVVAKYWPAIYKILKEKLQPAAVDLVTDDERIQHVAMLVYPFLPTFVQLIVREKDFARICLRNRDLVLEMYNKSIASRVPSKGG